MNYEEVKKNGSNGSNLRIKFVKAYRKLADSYRVHIFLPKDIRAQMGISYGDKMSLFVSPQNNKEWLIKKNTNGDGYKISKHFDFGVTWTKFVPEKEILNKVVSVKYNFKDDKKSELIINL